MTDEIAIHHVNEASDVACHAFGDNLFVPKQVALHAIDNNLDLKESITLFADDLTQLALQEKIAEASARNHGHDLAHNLVPIFLSLGHMMFESSVYRSFRDNVRATASSIPHPHECVRSMRHLLLLPSHPRQLAHKIHMLALHHKITSEPSPSSASLRNLLHSTVGHIASFGATTRDGSMVLNGVEYTIVRKDRPDGTAFQITQGYHGASTFLYDTRPYTKTATL